MINPSKDYLHIYRVGEKLMSNIHNDALKEQMLDEIMVTSTQDLIEQVASMGNNLLINQLDNVIDKLLEHKFEEQSR